MRIRIAFVLGDLYLSNCSKWLCCWPSHMKCILKLLLCLLLLFSLFFSPLSHSLQSASLCPCHEGVVPLHFLSVVIGSTVPCIWHSAGASLVQKLIQDVVKFLRLLLSSSVKRLPLSWETEGESTEDIRCKQVNDFQRFYFFRFRIDLVRQHSSWEISGFSKQTI